MNQIINEDIRIILASEGYILTQKAEVPAEERVFTDSLHLGKFDSAVNWTEITVEEAEALKKEIEALIEEQLLKGLE